MSAEVPVEIERLAEGCVRFVAQAVGAPLDGTPDTLPILDHYLLETARSGEAAGQPKEEVRDLVVASAGAYFGEVVRMALGARWALRANADATDATQYRLELDHVFLAIDPFALAHAALDPESEEVEALSIRPEERALLAASLERLGPVEGDDYVRLAVRFEVIEHCIAALEGAAQARGETEMRFGPAAYARALD